MSDTFPMWVYHAEKEPKIINSKDLVNAKKSGWKDSPAKCKEKKSK